MAQDDSAYQDNPYGTQDPAALFQSLTTQNNADRSGAGLVRQSMMQLGGNPQMQHAQMIQQNMAKIMSDNPAQEGEDPLDTQLRQARAVMSGMLKIDPATAMKANQQIIRLQEAKKQQANLESETAQRAALTTSENIKNAQARTVVMGQENEMVNGLSLRTTKSFGTLDPKSPTYNTDLADMLAKNPGSVPMNNDDYVKALATDNQNRAMAMYYGAANRINAQADVAGKVPYSQMSDQQKDLAGYRNILGIQQPQDQQDKGSIRVAEKIRDGELSMDDVAQAPVQFAALKRATLSASDRDGKIKGLAESLRGLGNNVNTALDQVVRVGASPTDIRLVNAAVQWGDKNFMTDDHTEKGEALRQLFVSMNELVYEHGRLLSGGGARTNVSAVADAKKNMTVSDSPNVIRAAVSQIIDKALPVIDHANDSAIQVLSDPDSYKAVAKMALAFGGANMWGMKDDQSLRAAKAPPSQNPSAPPPIAAPAPPAAPTGQGSTYRSLWLRTPSGPAPQ
jgi:hypothetical protein